MIKHNDLKKGDKIRLKDGGTATMLDSKAGIIRMISAHGDEGERSDNWVKEAGSCYVDRITHVEIQGEWERIEISALHNRQMSRIRTVFR